MTVFLFKKEKKEENLLYTSNEKVFIALHWLCKQKITHSKLNYMLEMLKSLDVEEVKQFRKHSSTILRDLLLTIGNKEKLVSWIRSPFFGILTEEVTDISNVQNLVTFIKYYGHEKGEVETAFIDSTNLLNFSETYVADPQTVHDCLINLISNLKLELPNLKAFLLERASVMTGSKRGVAAKLREHQSLKHLLNVDSINQLNFLIEFELTLTVLWTFFNNLPKGLAKDST